MTSVVPAPKPERADPVATVDPGDLIAQALVAPGAAGAAVVESGVVEPVEVEEGAVSAVDVVAELRGLVSGPVHGPHDVGTVTELAAAGPAGARPPLAVVGATATSDVAAVVGWAARHDIPVRVLGPGATGWSDDAVVVTTRRMDRVIVDPDSALAWLGAGVTWRQLLHAAADVGVVGPVGPDADHGVVRTLLAGGHCVGVRVRSCTVVTSDGQVVESERAVPDGIVTEMEIAVDG